MSPILNQIDDSLVGYTPGQPEFAQLVSDTLGNLGDSTDGFDSALAAVLATVPATDQAAAALDSPLADLSAAVDNFNSLDTNTWAAEPIPQLPALASEPKAPQANAPGSITLPSLPAPPNANPNPQPPTTCQPAPSSSPSRTPPIPKPPIVVLQPQPGGTPCPQGMSFNSTLGKCVPLCPPGYSFTADGRCLPSPVQPAGLPPLPTIQLPSIPQGLPPCPQGFTATSSGDCLPAGSSDLESKLLMVLGQEILSLTSQEVVPVTASWVTSFAGLSLANSELIVTAIIGVAALLISILGGGCGEACIDAAKVEQVYEAIGDDILRTAKAGMIGGADAVIALTHFLGVGDLALTRLGTSQAAAGKRNMDPIIAQLIAVARTLPPTATAPLDIAAAQKLFVGGAGWYSDSIAAASQVVTQFLTGLQFNVVKVT